MSDPGWLVRQMERTERDIKELPSWLRSPKSEASVSIDVENPVMKIEVKEWNRIKATAFQYAQLFGRMENLAREYERAGEHGQATTIRKAMYGEGGS